MDTNLRVMAKIASKGTEGKFYFIERSGDTKKEGGKGTKWSCSCSQHQKHGRVCWHLRWIFNKQFEKFQLTLEGRKFFGLA